MRVFVTGATGLIGRHAAAAIKAAGHDVVALARSHSSAEQLEQAGYQVELGDMVAPDEWKAEASRADALVHAALYHRRLRASRMWLRQAEKADRVALEGLIAAARAGKRCVALVETSGTLVYGDHGEDWLDEDATPRPTAMGSYHLHGEQLVREAAKKGIPACSLRIGLTYSATGLFAGVFLEPATRGSAYVIGAGQNYQSPVHIADVGRAFACAVEKPAPGAALNVVDDEPLRMVDFAQRVLDGFRAKRSHIRHVPPWMVSMLAGKPVGEMVTISARCRNQRIKDRLGWRPQFPTSEEGLTHVVQEFRSQG